MPRPRSTKPKATIPQPPKPIEAKSEDLDSIEGLERWCEQAMSQMDTMQKEANVLYEQADAIVAKGNEIAMLYRARQQRIVSMKERRDEQKFARAHREIDTQIEPQPRATGFAHQPDLAPRSNRADNWLSTEYPGEKPARSGNPMVENWDEGIVITHER